MGVLSFTLAVILGTLAFFAYHGKHEHSVNEVQRVGRLPGESASLSLGD